MILKKYFIFLICIVIISCTDDSTDVNSDNDEIESDDDKDIILDEAFPLISFSQPVDLQTSNDGSNRIFIVEKRGIIRVFSNNSAVDSATDFFDITSKVSSSGELGLLGLAFHPNYTSNGFFYIYYNPTPSLSRISRFRVSDNDANKADLESEVTLLEIVQPETNHNGGQLIFGPNGYLYIALGDGGGSGDPQYNGQNSNSLLGSILRIDVDASNGNLNFGIPSDNPFIGDSNIRDEIYAYGLRNPWRMSFDTATGNLWTADVGQGQIEEINIITSGANYGWNVFEGTLCFLGDCDASGMTPPIFEYTHDNGDLSITGGFVYRGSEISSLEGKYIYGDFISGRIWTLDTNSKNELLFNSRLNIASFGTDSNQELYVCDFGGKIYKFKEN